MDELGLRGFWALAGQVRNFGRKYNQGESGLFSPLIVMMMIIALGLGKFGGGGCSDLPFIERLGLVKGSTGGWRFAQSPLQSLYAIFFFQSIISLTNHLQNHRRAKDGEAVLLRGDTRILQAEAEPEGIGGGRGVPDQIPIESDLNPLLLLSLKITTIS